MTALTIRAAAPEELDEVLDILSEAAAWLASRGIDQWPARFPRQQTAERIDRGDVYLALVDDEPAATITLDTWADPEFWDHPPDDAGYVHRMAVRRKYAGHSLGQTLLDWAGEHVAATGRRWLRLDCNKDNRQLQNYYLQLGFRHVADIDLPHRKSGSLFERPVGI